MNLHRRSALVLGAAAVAMRSVAARAQTSEIIVGAPNALTGGYGEGGRQVVAGLQIAVDEINNKGGIKALQGRKLKLGYRPTHPVTSRPRLPA